ncbi:MAG: hypothetical protein HOV94_21815 [Saccharothrix sp.]|nr:hypothetical protein [Saccharothrix sp.]
MTPDQILSTARTCMTKGDATDAAALLEYSWLTTSTDGRPSDIGELHAITLELADRFPLSEAVSTLLYRATVTYAEREVFSAAGWMATRMPGVWRARCQAELTTDTLTGIFHALDTLAGVSKAQGAVDVVIRCLVELIEWSFDCGNTVGVVWAVRELGALAFMAGDLDNAVAKFTRANELPEPTVLKIGEFGLPTWNSTEPPPTRSGLPA